MPIVYAFDIDDCLEISRGPVTFQMIIDLKNQGHIVGLNGNWGLVTQVCKDWWFNLFSFFNVGLPKPVYLTYFRQYVPADDYVMVGNIGNLDAPRFNLTATGGSDDMGAAADAQPPWRFILEREFANGVR
jgi:hypothetical protein